MAATHCAEMHWKCTGKGKTLIQLHGSRVIGGETLSYCHFILLTLILSTNISVKFIGHTLNNSIACLYYPNVTITK